MVLHGLRNKQEGVRGSAEMLGAHAFSKLQREAVQSCDPEARSRREGYAAAHYGCPQTDH